MMFCPIEWCSVLIEWMFLSLSSSWDFVNFLGKVETESRDFRYDYTLSFVARVSTKSNIYLKLFLLQIKWTGKAGAPNSRKRNKGRWIREERESTGRKGERGSRKKVLMLLFSSLFYRNYQHASTWLTFSFIPCRVFSSVSDWIRGVQFKILLKSYAHFQDLSRTLFVHLSLVTLFLYRKWFLFPSENPFFIQFFMFAPFLFSPSLLRHRHVHGIMSIPTGWKAPMLTSLA